MIVKVIIHIKLTSLLSVFSVGWFGGKEEVRPEEWSYMYILRGNGLVRSGSLHDNVGRVRLVI